MVAIKTLAVDYSVFQLISRGIVVDHITLTAPRVHLVRDGEGWNIGRLVKERAQEADRAWSRTARSRCRRLPSSTARSPSTTVRARRTTACPGASTISTCRPSFEYEPVHFTIGLSQLSFRGADPDLALQQLTGAIAVRDDNLYLERIVVKTGESAAERRRRHRKLSPDAGDQAGGRRYRVAAGGRADRAGAVRLPAAPDARREDERDARSAGDGSRMSRPRPGSFAARSTTDLRSPDFAFAGPFHVERLNLAPDPQESGAASDITGDVRSRLDAAVEPADDAGASTARRHVHVQRPARASRSATRRPRCERSGSFKGPRITLSAAQRARLRRLGDDARRYRSARRAGGRLVRSAGHRRGRRSAAASRLDAGAEARHGAVTLRLPREGQAARPRQRLGDAQPSQRRRRDGRTGTVVEFDNVRDAICLRGEGELAGLDVRRLGKALEIAALDDARYEGRVSGDFDVRASGTTLEELKLSATRHADGFGDVGHARAGDDVQGEHRRDGADASTAKGAFDQLNPAVVLERKALDGNVNGTVDATLRIADLSAPVTPTSIDGRRAASTLAPSLIGGVQIAGAEIEGRYADEIADITRLHVDGPDVTLDASGRLALGRTATSNLKYHIDATDITEIGRIAGQDGLDGHARPRWHDHRQRRFARDDAAR